MKVTRIFNYIYLEIVKHRLNKNGNYCGFQNRALPLSSQIECEDGAQYKIKGLILKNGCCLRLRKGSSLEIGSNVSFNNNCTLTCRGKISIGDNTNIGPCCSIFDHDHDYRASDRKGTFKTGTITIGKNVWIGANVVILKDSVIGDNCVVGAGSIVKGVYRANTVIAGNPAVEKKQI